MCFAHGRDTDWEAICVDLDIAVQGESFEEVRALLREAIQTYIEDACQEPPEVRDRLLSRTAPWHVRLGLAAKVVVYTLFEKSRKREVQASFGLPCPA